MDDRELRDLLQALPRDQASPDLAARVTARLEQVDRRLAARRRRMAPLALAATVTLAAGSTLLYHWNERRVARAEQVEQARLERLETEYNEIREELGELQRLVAAAQPMVGVQGPGERGYLVDVGELARARAQGAVPVAYRLPQ